MSSPPATPPLERDLPRWFQVSLGLLLGAFTLLCGLGAVSILANPTKKAATFEIVLGSVLLLACLWILEKCFRLLTGRKNRGGLLSPSALRVVSLGFLVFPVLGLFAGYYRQHFAIGIFITAMYVLSFLGLRALARKRESAASADGQSED